MEDERICPFCGGRKFKPGSTRDLAWCATCHHVHEVDGARTTDVPVITARSPIVGTWPN